MKIDLICSETQYWRHAMPVFEALPAELKGRARMEPDPITPALPGRAALVASFQDVRALWGRCPVIYVEHGSGQSYGGDPRSSFQPGYSASRGRRNRGVIGYICPNETVAALWEAPSIAVGCPKMDEYVGLGELGDNENPTAVIGFHWDCKISPEATSAWLHYRPRLEEIQRHFSSHGWDLFGHVHPRWKGTLDGEFAKAGIPMLKTDDEVFRRADLLLYDNSSLAFEFASLGRQVWNLNAPWYRRDVEHGLRFWSHVPGIQFDEPDELLAINPAEMFLADLGADKRRAAVEHAYAFTDGTSSERAAAWIAELLESR